MNNISLGIVAHVDAGKTTLSEAILYHTGMIRQKGRVDHGDAFLDTHALEKQRGITIYSKQANFSLGHKNFFLLDTPGHTDFSSEMERVLYVLDYCILIISGAESVTPKVQELWDLLAHYEVPTFIFVNKMDHDSNDKIRLLADIKDKLTAACVEFTDPRNPFTEEEKEEIVVNDEKLLEKYLQGDLISSQDIASLIKKRQLFPVFWGSALHEEGIEELLAGMAMFMEAEDYPSEFGARVFKISRDKDNIRLTWLKVTGGTLKNRMPLSFLAKASKTIEDDQVSGSDEDRLLEEKVDQIRIYSGAKYESVPEATAGVVCAVTGLKETYVGMGLGIETENIEEVIEPVLAYRIILGEGEDTFRAYRLLRGLEEEDPLLNFNYKKNTDQITINMMGQVQMETLQFRAKANFDLDIDFADPEVIYKETIQGKVFGLGHFEPLGHYAEVIIKIEAGETGSGVVIKNVCSPDILKINWQNLVLSSLKNVRHKGVLIASDLTDVKISLMYGKGHEKHTSSGDFQAATIRAVRQGLMQAKNVILEPIYTFKMQVAQENLGRAMADLDLLGGNLQAPDIRDKTAYLTGDIPAIVLGDYIRDFQAYTGGEGRISFKLKGYYPCPNAENIITAQAYDPEGDLANPVNSVFCREGVGYTVPWYEVHEHIHAQDALRSFILAEQKNEQGLDRNKQWILHLSDQTTKGISKEEYRSQQATENELIHIFEQTYGPVKNQKQKNLFDDRPKKQQEVQAMTDQEKAAFAEKLKKRPNSYLIVDGYNVMHASPQLKALAEDDFSAARKLLIDILINYQGYRQERVILVFDAYKVVGGREIVEKNSGLSVVYTREKETADQYIEKATKEKIKNNAQVIVASSDGQEQIVIFNAGAYRMSAREFWLQIEAANTEIREMLEGDNHAK